MDSKYSTETNWLWMVCVFVSGILLLYWKSSLARKFWALLGRLQSSDLRWVGHRDTASARSTDSNVIQEYINMVTHPLPYNKTEGSQLSRRVYKYDVFLSFRGPDTRNSFTDHLYNHLIRKGIFTFKDDERLEQGHPISSQLLQAIKDSRISIIVFSRDYADSTWCLEEMATIAECKNELEQMVFPIFYDVDPSHVRKQIGVYQGAFVSLTKKFKQDPGKVARWKRAMTELANLVGWDVRYKPQFTEIEKIIQKVIKTLDHKFSGSVDDLIGIQPRVEKLEKLLELNSSDDDFRVLGICGMGGIGKTTHTTVLYDRISYLFDACCFIENVSKNYKDGGAIAIQKQILCQTLDEQNLDICSPSKISGIVRNRLSPMKVLIILDNVEELEQLENLAISPKLLGRGSRIIITTRNEHILKVYGADAIHKVPLLNDDDACELLLRKAFKSEDSSSSSCVELTPKILEYAQSLPLAIKVVGSFLCTRDAIQWRDALERLRKNPDKKIMDVLQISFEGLQQEEKEIFLHVACFFRGEREEYVKRILDSCGLQPHIGIQVLMEKSLITITNQEIHMHEMLQELGKKIVREKYPEEPGSWSRLWLYKDFENVLMLEMATNNVKAIVLDQKEKVSKSNQLRIEGLSKMRGLKLLILHHKNFSGSLNFLSNSLQYLFWHGYPFSSLPLFELYSNLVELNLPNSSIKRLWEGSKNIPYLERMDLSNSKDLVETPNFEWCQRLMRLDLSGCTNLSRVHPSIGLLKNLAHLSLRNCSSLISLHFGTKCELSSLRVLYLSGCTKLQNTPDFTGLSNLEYLDLEQCTSLSAVHTSIGTLAKLKFFSLRDCINLTQMSSCVFTMPSLQTLDMRGCFNFETMLPVGFPRGTVSWLRSYQESLIFLDLSFCNLSEVPKAIENLRCLERLNLQGNKIRYLDTEHLSSLAYLNLAHCYELNKLPICPFDRASSRGRYFKTLSASRNHRSGLYISDCPISMKSCSMLVALLWLARLIEQPCLFRCGFDIVIPVDKSKIPEWYFDHQFEGGSIVRIVDSDMNDNWLGFAFCVSFQVNNSLAIDGSSSHSSAIDGCSSLLPHPLYLSFESEHTEETFHMPYFLDPDKDEHLRPFNMRHHSSSDGSISKHAWIIYISRVHCHFVKTGAHITFKAHPSFKVQKWGLRMVFNNDTGALRRKLRYNVDILGLPDFWSTIRLPDYWLIIEKVYESSSSSGPKIQLPYNWFVNEEEENENMAAKTKENNLSNTGLSIGQPQ